MSISRRRFLRLSVCSAPPLIGLASCGKQASSESVVIIGAGLAGLRAADILLKAGRQVVVLEARDRPGGRVQTIRSAFDDGLFAEAGPIRISSAHKSVIRLVRELGLNLVPFDSGNGSALLRINGENFRSDALAQTKLPLQLKPDERKLRQGELISHYVGDLPADLADPDPSPASYRRWAAIDQVTWPAWLRGRGASDDAVKLMTLGGDSSELSALYVLRQIALLRKSVTYKIQGGMDLLPRAMESSIHKVVRYNAAVVRIDQTSRPVRIDYTENGRMKSIRSGHVVVTTPLTTLRRIEIRPPFSSEKERAIENIPYFPATRFLLQTRNRFWYESHLSAYARTDQPAEIWDCTYDVGGLPGILGATIGGALGRKVLDLGPEESVKFGTDAVAEAFPPIRHEFQKGFAQRWALEPWSRGAFAVFRPGQMVSLMPDLARPEGRVHFAGEHTSSWMGWMEGAVESGERAAKEILHTYVSRY